MKKPLIILLFLGAAPLFSLAQRSDIYITGDKVTGNDYMNQSATSISSSWEQTSAAEESYSIQSPVQSSMKRDIDEYNRRYSSSNQASEIAYSDDIYQNSAVWVDTVYILENDAEAYAEGYSDASMDYEYALRMIRFRSPRLSSYISSPFYWDVVYGSSAYALNDYYWDLNWYLDPWGYNRYSNNYYIGSPYMYSGIWYDPWYNPWYSSWYNPWYGPVSTGVPVYATRGQSAFVPNRSVNSGWSRNLAGSQRSTRDSFSGVSRTDRDLSSVRSNSTRSLDIDNRTVSSRTVTETRTSSRIDGSSRSSGINTGSSVRIASPGASSRSVTVTPSTSRIGELEVNTVRSAQSGTTYNRPSSTSSRLVTTPVESGSDINRGGISNSSSSVRTNIGISSSSSSSSRVSTPATSSSSSSSSSRVSTPATSSSSRSSSSRVSTPATSSSSSSRGAASSSRR